MLGTFIQVIKLVKTLRELSNKPEKLYDYIKSQPQVVLNLSKDVSTDQIHPWVVEFVEMVETGGISKEDFLTFVKVLDAVYKRHGVIDETDEIADNSAIEVIRPDASSSGSGFMHRWSSSTTN